MNMDHLTITTVKRGAVRLLRQVGVLPASRQLALSSDDPDDAEIEAARTLVGELADHVKRGRRAEQSMQQVLARFNAVTPPIEQTLMEKQSDPTDLAADMPKPVAASLPTNVVQLVAPRPVDQEDAIDQVLELLKERKTAAFGHLHEQLDLKQEKLAAAQAQIGELKEVIAELATRNHEAGIKLDLAVGENQTLTTALSQAQRRLQTEISNAESKVAAAISAGELASVSAQQEAQRLKARAKWYKAALIVAGLVIAGLALL